MSSEIAILISAILVATAVSALVSKSVSVSLIMLFYSSLIVGIIFTAYGSTIIGLFEIITFAGAISVMLLTTVLMTGESTLKIGTNKLDIAIVLIAVAVVALASTLSLRVLTAQSTSGSNLTAELLQFLWQFRPWDMLILLVVFTSAMVVVVNLFSRESQ